VNYIAGAASDRDGRFDPAAGPNGGIVGGSAVKEEQP
jgi:hypothetical protein